MPNAFRYDVFLGHSAKDKAIVRDIAGRLKKDGLKVWFDEWEIKLGDSIPAKTEDGLEHSRVLVLCMSANAFGSDWAQLEPGTFRFRDPLNKERRMVCLRLDHTPLQGPLSELSYFDWLIADQEREYFKLLESSRPPTRELSQDDTTSLNQLVQKIYSRGHSDWIRSVASSPDGSLALSGAYDHTLRLWDVNSGRCLRVMVGHSESVYSVAFSPDAHLALSGSADHTVRIWEMKNGRCLQTIKGHLAGVFSVVFCSDGLRALTGSADLTIRLWDVNGGNPLRVIEGHSATIVSLAISLDDRYALSGSMDKTVRLWDLDSGVCLHILEGHSGIVWGVAFSPDGTIAATGSSDNTVRLWDLDSGRCLHCMEGHSSSVWAVAFTSDGLGALSASYDHTVCLWDVAKGKRLHTLKERSKGIWCASFSSDGRRVLIGEVDRKVRIRDVQSGQSVSELEDNSNMILSMAFSTEGLRALTSSDDKTLRLWDVRSGSCSHIFKGHDDNVHTVAFSPDGLRFLSGSNDSTLRLWDVKRKICIAVLKGHSAGVVCLAFSSDGRRALSGSEDKTVRLWDLTSSQCISVMSGHSESVSTVVFSPDQLHVLSGSSDKTMRSWDGETGRCLAVLVGHDSCPASLSWSGRTGCAIAGYIDGTIGVWDVCSGRCLRVIEGHTGCIGSLDGSVASPLALSGSTDNTVRVWDLNSGRCLRVLNGHKAEVVSVTWHSNCHFAFSGDKSGGIQIWDTSELVADALVPNHAEPSLLTAANQVQYTNAKALLVGESGAGKTGLSKRLALHLWEPSDSTVGAWATQWKLPVKSDDRADREIWLWDFGGQADQRLIHQLYMDRSALILLLFNADQEDVLPGLRDWQTALRRCVKHKIPQFLVAGRIDTGFKASRRMLQAFAKEQGLAYHETSAKDGTGCDELRAAMIAGIPWKQMEKRTSPRIFKLIKDEILRLRDEGQVLHTFKELRELLWRRLPDEPRFTDETLQTVIGLLDGPGVVKELDYGTYVLLAPEWINAYAQAVILTLRSDPQELGALQIRSIAEGQLIYQSIGCNGSPVEMRRLPPTEERVVLGEMEWQLEQRGLCLRQGDKLVFPSHCGRDRPNKPDIPPLFVSYAIGGYLDDIFATLVVKMAGSECFRLKEHWRDAAEFETLSDAHHLGIRLSRNGEGHGEISIYYCQGVSDQEQVIFANYIHGHLEDTCEVAQRLRHYVCPKCHAPKGNAEVLMKKLLREKQAADTECDDCGVRFPLWDALERKFASESVRKHVEQLQADDLVKLTARRKGKLLVLDVGARITSANQKWIETPGDEDDGIDMQVEFTDEDGNGLGKGLCLQLKSGNSFLNKRKTDGIEIFAIKKQRWVKTWMNQPFPVMLVIGTFHEGDERSLRKDKLEFADVRWMEITSVLRRESENGTKPVKQIEFKGERLDMTSVRRWRDKLLQQ